MTYVVLAPRPAALVFYCAVASLAVASCIANQPNENGSLIELPTSPLYPAHGKIAPTLKDKFVFLDSKKYKLVVIDAERNVIARMSLRIGICPSLRLGGITKGWCQF